MKTINIDSKRQEILDSNGHLIILGGPGSGKTTIALYKAREIVNSNVLKRDQKILFLSFARATIVRMNDIAGEVISKEQMKYIELNTYHGFIWNILRNHGYLLNELPINILPPHTAAIKMSEVSNGLKTTKMLDLFKSEGLVHFDIFASLLFKLLNESNALYELFCDIYPFLIFDEFQDTNADEWQLIKLLGHQSAIISLADSNQRIYDFRGADPKRVNEFINTFDPHIIDLGIENNRSSDTDIVDFGNDLLVGKNIGKLYDNVDIIKYGYLDRSVKHLHLKLHIIRRMSLLRKMKNDWSIAVLVPTNYLLQEVSDFLFKEQTCSNNRKYPKISHNILIDTAGPFLAGLCIGDLLEKSSIDCCSEIDMLNSFCNYILGRKGDKSVSQADIKLVEGIRQYIDTGKTRGEKRNAIIAECKLIVDCCNRYRKSGILHKDWQYITTLFQSSNNEYLLKIGRDVLHLNVIRTNETLLSSTNDIWRINENYKGFVELLSNTLIQEHFSTPQVTWKGINLMTIHKAKGKEFDEVIIYEECYQNRLVSREDRIEQAKLSLRVGVTRAKIHATILTPARSPCELL